MLSPNFERPAQKLAFRFLVLLVQNRVGFVTADCRELEEKVVVDSVVALGSS